jgi:hypothetical protein
LVNAIWRALPYEDVAMPEDQLYEPRDEDIEDAIATIERAEARFKDLIAHINTLNAAAVFMSAKKPNETKQIAAYPASPQEVP